MTQTYTIEKEQLPSGLYSITFKQPKFKEYRNARKRYPTNDRVPYSLEELLFAMCMEEVNGQKIATNPKDIVERLEPFPIADRQFLLTLFIEMFFLSRDRSQAGQELATNLLKEGYRAVHGISAEEMPSNEYSVVFNPPNTGVQMEVDRQYQGVSNSGSSLEEMLMAFCLSSVNGAKVEPSKDILSVLDEWDIADVQFASTVFVNLYTIDSNGTSKAKKLAALLKPTKSLTKTESTGKATTQKI